MGEPRLRLDGRFGPHGRVDGDTHAQNGFTPEKFGGEKRKEPLAVGGVEDRYSIKGRS
jgi:hypothetical protein